MIFVFIVIALGFFFFEGFFKDNNCKISASTENFLWNLGVNSEKSLEFEKAQYITQLIELEDIKKENIILREALGLDFQSDFNLELVSVTSKYYPENIIKINKGSNDGILKGMEVITSNRALVGKILNSYDDFSEVSLITNKDNVFDVKTLKEDVLMIANGDGSNISLKDIDRDALISKDDYIVTSAEGGQYTRGLLVGKIIEINNIDSEVYMSGKAKPMFELRDLDKIFVIKNDK